VTKKTFQEQVADLQTTIAAKRQAQTEIMNKAAEEGRSTNEEEGQKFDELAIELKQMDADLARLDTLIAANVKTAAPIAGKTQAEGTASRSAAYVKHVGDEEKFKGQNFTRGVIAKAVARLENKQPVEVAMARWGKAAPRFVETMKAAVAGGGSGSGEWGAELVTMENYEADFIEFLYSMTVFDKLGLREIPANVTIKGQDGASTGYWVGQSKAIPVTTADFFNVSLTPLKVAALAVVSNELMQDSSPSAELLVRDSLARASAQRVDQTFISSSAAVAGVSPAGILAGVTGTAASGTTADALRADIKTLYASFIAAKNASDLRLVMNPALAKSVSLMVNALGQSEFPGLNTGGGTLLGDQVVTGDNVGATSMILLKPSDIYRIGDTGIDIRISDVATVEQDTVPTGATDTPAAATLNITSMFQEESSAIRVIRRINFAKRRASAVDHITGAAYSA
jgi:HK97 family phage major capsid protein